MTPAVLALLSLVTFQQAVDRAHCWAYPHHERCKPTPPAPVQAPIPPPPPPQATPPVTTPAATPAPPRVIPKPKVQPKPKFKPAPVRKRLSAVQVASWCSQVPKGTTMGQIEMFAKLRGVKMNATHRRQAQVCLNSK